MEKEPLLPSSSSSSNPQSNLQSFILSDNSKKKFYRSNTAPSMSNTIDFSSSVPMLPVHFGKISIVRHAVILLILYLIIGVALCSFFMDQFKSTKTHPIVDALYYCIISMCTIGYGDITPDSTLTKSFAILFALVGFGFINILLTGLVTYVSNLQQSYLRTTTEEYSSYVKVALAFGVSVFCIGIGVVFMHFVERIEWFDSFYLSVVGITTVGYGEKVFKSMGGRIFASVWLLLSTLAVARAFLFLAEATVDKRQMIIEKWVLDQDMTVAQFRAADIDNNGFVSKSEYVLYKLKELGKITEKDILMISKPFERLDTGNRGKITLSNLMESHN